VLPGTLRAASAGSMLVYVLIAVVLVDAAGVTDVLGGDWTAGAAWGLAGFFLLGVAINRALCVLSLLVAVGGSRSEL